MKGKCHPDYYTQFLLYFGIFTYETLNIIIMSNGSQRVVPSYGVILIVTTVHIIISSKTGLNLCFGFVGAAFFGFVM